MAELKRRTLLLSTGKEIKLFGNSIAIGKSLEIGEGYAPNLFSVPDRQEGKKESVGINNPHRFTVEEMMELADYNIQLWMDLKANLRRYGIESPKLFNRE